MRIIQTRLAWETERRPFGVHDWGLPVAFIGAMFFISLTGIISVMSLANWMSALPVPFIDMTVGEYLGRG